MKTAIARTALAWLIAAAVSLLPAALQAQHRPPPGLSARAVLVGATKPASSAAVAPLLPGRTGGELSSVRNGAVAGWAFALGGAVVGGVVGFSAAAPDCLDGSTGCGSRPLVFAAAGAAAGAALGWALYALIRSD